MRFKSWIVGAALALSSVSASASVVQFLQDPSLFFADGSFTHNLGPVFPDGFYISGDSNGAYNGYGEDGESVLFDAPVQFNSLLINRCGFCQDTGATSFTVSLYDTTSALLASQTVASSLVQQLLLFDVNEVSRVTFTFAGGTDIYDNGRLHAYYVIHDLTYGPNVIGGVPEAATWAMMIAGFGLVGSAKRRSRSALAA